MAEHTSFRAKEAKQRLRPLSLLFSTITLVLVMASRRNQCSWTLAIVLTAASALWLRFFQPTRVAKNHPLKPSGIDLRELNRW
jgi:hypothetical protein